MRMSRIGKWLDSGIGCKILSDMDLVSPLRTRIFERSRPLALC